MYLQMGHRLLDPAPELVQKLTIVALGRMLHDVVDQVEQHQLLLDPYLKGNIVSEFLLLKLYLLDDFYPTSGHLVCRPPVLDAPSRKALYGLLSVLQVDQNLHELLLLKLVVLPGTHPQALSYCTSPTFGIWKARLVVLSFEMISHHIKPHKCLQLHCNGHQDIAINGTNHMLNPNEPNFYKIECQRWISG